MCLLKIIDSHCPPYAETIAYKVMQRVSWNNTYCSPYFGTPFGDSQFGTWVLDGSAKVLRCSSHPYQSYERGFHCLKSKDLAFALAKGISRQHAGAEMVVCEVMLRQLTAVGVEHVLKKEEVVAATVFVAAEIKFLRVVPEEELSNVTD